MYCWICCILPGREERSREEEQFGEQRWRCTLRVTDAKLEVGGWKGGRGGNDKGEGRG